MAEIARFELKKEQADSAYNEANEKTKEDIIKAKKAHDFLLETMVVCVITCQAELLKQASLKLDEVVSMLPQDKVNQFKHRMHDFISQGGVKPVKLELTATEKALAIATGKALPSDFKKSDEDIARENAAKQREIDNARALVEKKAGGGASTNPFEDSPSPIPAKSSNPKVKGLYEHIPEQDDELAFNVGDIIEVLETGEDGWWKGQCNGKEGMFPVNYVVHL